MQAIQAVRAGATAATVGVFTLGGSYSAVSAVQSFHGDDYSQDYNNRNNLQVCDREADSNPIKGGVSFNNDRSEQDTLHNGDGSGTCSSGEMDGDTITHHHTCEQNHITWDCNNWQSTTK